MPFQSEKQRRFLPANHPEIAKRWEREYSHGGILDINESEEIISDDGNDIELTDYNAAFDNPNDLSTGVKTLFQAKDGGRIGYGWGGPGGKSPGTSAGPGPGGQGAVGQATQNPGVTGTTGTTGSHANKGWQTYAIGPSTTTKGGDDSIPHHTKDDEEEQKKTDALNRNIQRKKDLARIALQTYKPTAKKEKIENTPEEKGFWDQLSTVLGILTFGPVIVIKMPVIVNTLSSVVNTKKNIDKLTTYGIQKGWLSEDMTVDKLTEKFIDHTKKQKAKMDEYDSLPKGHPDKIALGIELQIGKTTDDGDGGFDDVPELPPQLGGPSTEEMATEYGMSNFERIKAGQAKYAAYIDKIEREKLALEENPIVGTTEMDIIALGNSGGLANLFRVKNQ